MAYSQSISTKNSPRIPSSPSYINEYLATDNYGNVCQGVKCKAFKRSNGLDTALYKTYLFLAAEHLSAGDYLRRTQLVDVSRLRLREDGVGHVPLDPRKHSWILCNPEWTSQQGGAVGVGERGVVLTGRPRWKFR